jgi:membrane-associated phospholipid phosphatase
MTKYFINKFLYFSPKRWQNSLRNTMFIILFFSFFNRGGACDRTSLSLKADREWTVLSSGAVLFGVGIYFYRHVIPPDSNLLDQSALIPMDRFAIRCDNQTHAVISNAALGVCSVLPMVSIISAKDEQQLKTQALITVESYLITTGLTYLVKGVVRRPRPYVYRERNLSLKRDAGRSFFSGHTSMAFNGAILAALMFQEENRDSQWIAPIWIGGISTAALTGIFRVTSGNHFPTDVLAGALAGSIIGIGIVHLHQR